MERDSRHGYSGWTELSGNFSGLVREVDSGMGEAEPGDEISISTSAW